MLSMNQCLPAQNFFNASAFTTYNTNGHQQQFPTNQNFDQYQYHGRSPDSSLNSSSNNNNNQPLRSLTPPISPENVNKFPLNLAMSERIPYRTDVIAQPNITHVSVGDGHICSDETSAASCARNLFSTNGYHNNVETGGNCNYLQNSAMPNDFQLPNSLNSLFSHELMLFRAPPTSPCSKKTAAGRNQRKPIPFEQKDEKYFERRRRNNAAAKKSRDNRKYREGENAVRAAHLQQENAVLRAEKATLEEVRNEMEFFYVRCNEQSCFFPNDKSEPSRKGTHDVRVFLECSRDNFFVAKLCPVDTSFDNRTLKCMKNYHPPNIRQHQLKILNNGRPSTKFDHHPQQVSPSSAEVSKKKTVAEFQGDCSNGQWCPYNGSKIQVCNVAGSKFLLCTPKGWMRKKCAPGRVFNREKGLCLAETATPVPHMEMPDKIMGQQVPHAPLNQAKIVENSPQSIKSESLENPWFSYPWHSRSTLIDPQHPLYSATSVYPDPEVQMYTNDKTHSGHSNAIPYQLPTYHQTAFWNPYPGSNEQKSPYMETQRSWHNNQKPPMTTSEADLIWHFANILARQYLQQRSSNAAPQRPMSLPLAQAPTSVYDDTSSSSASSALGSSVSTSELLPDHGIGSSWYGNPVSYPYYNQQLDWSSFLSSAKSRKS